MSDFITMIITVLLAQNLLLVIPFAFGSDPGVFRKENSLATGFCLWVVLTILTPVAQLLHLSLIQMGISQFSLLCNALVSCMGAMVLCHGLSRVSPDLHSIFQETLASLPIHGGILCVILLSQQENHTFFESLIFAFFSGLGAFIALATLTGIQNQQEDHNKITAFRGLPILFITAGLLSMSLLGFYGL